MDKRQEQFSQFGTLLFIIILTYAVSALERGVIMDEIKEIKTLIKDK